MAEAMSNSKSSENQKVIFCRWHNQEQYQLYCRECRDLVCFECLQDQHLKHNMCRILDSEKDVRAYLQSELLEKEEIVKMNEQIDAAMNALIEKKKDMIDEIVKEADCMKNQIALSKENLIVNVASTFDGYVPALDVNERFRCFKDRITEENIRQYDFLKLLEIMVEWRDIIETTSKIRHFANSVKIEKTPCKFFIGEIVSLRNTGEKHADSIQAKSFNARSTQTQNIASDDEDNEWFDAVNKENEEDSIEYSSSIETREKYPIYIRINEDVQTIQKIILLSETNAWIIADRKLRFIKEYVLEQKVYATDIDDIAVLKNGNVLLLCRTQSFIMQLLPNDTIVRFAKAKCHSAMPNCVCVSQNEEVIVLSSSEPQKNCNSYRFQRNIYIMKLTKDGVLIHETYGCNQTYGKPCNVLDFQSNVCVTFQNMHPGNLHFLEILNVSTGENLFSYCGSIGYNPSCNFECYGICSDQNNHLLVSDFRHHCVNALDENLKYKKRVVSSTNGLHDPTAVALWKNYLWIGDKQKILIFKYDSAEILLHSRFC